MREPIRWRDPRGETDGETRALLAGDAGPSPSADEANRIWAGLSRQLPPGPGQAPPGGASGPAVGALAGKITLAVLLISAAGIGLYRWQSRARSADTDLAAPSDNAPRVRAEAVDPPAVTAPAAPVAVAPGAAVPTAASARREGRPRGNGPARGRPTGDSPADAVATEATVAGPSAGEERPLASSWGRSPLPTPVPDTSGEPRPVLPVNQLLAESRQLERARAALRAGDPDRALVLLAPGSLPAATLVQEREALTIEALAAKPALRAQATARARAFLAAYPQSPYRARIRAVALAGE
jgi:hypothetical protein